MRTRALAVAVLLVGSALAAEPPKPYEVSGVGSIVLSASVTAQWLLGKQQQGRPQPLLMVYYRGAPGWHNTKWKSNAELGKTPAWTRLTSPTAELSIEYGPGGVNSKVQGRSVDLTVSNVFLVSQVGDTSTTPSVEPIGLVVFAVPEGDDPARFVLETNPSLKAKVMP